MAFTHRLRCSINKTVPNCCNPDWPPLSATSQETRNSILTASKFINNSVPDATNGP